MIEVEDQKVLGPPIFTRRQTATIWQNDQLIRAMRMEDISLLLNYMRMEPLRVGPRIKTSDTNFRRALEPGLELAKTPIA